MNLTNTYKDYTISYNGTYYIISLDGIDLTTKPKSIEACIEWIDKQLKQKFIRTKVLVFSYPDIVKEAEATSIVDDKVRVVYEDGKRETKEINYLKTFNESNLEKVDKIEKLAKQINELKKESLAIRGSLEQFNINEMLEG